jgi:putative Mg2+ transporter-C (MgtC) family protein
MLVSMGTALLVISAIESGMHEDAVSRVIQGIVTGIGFLGAGVIMKIHESREIRGLTTAAGIWMTAAAGVAIGLGRIGLGLIAAALTWVVLAILRKFEPERQEKPSPEDRNS